MLKEHRSLHGLYRALIANMIKGVTDGFARKLELVGVGYRAEIKGKVLQLALRLFASHHLPCSGRNQDRSSDADQHT